MKRLVKAKKIGAQGLHIQKDSDGVVGKLLATSNGKRAQKELMDVANVKDSVGAETTSITQITFALFLIVIFCCSISSCVSASAILCFLLCQVGLLLFQWVNQFACIFGVRASMVVLVCNVLWLRAQ